MRNKQIQNLALVLADLSDISHVNSTMSFINMSGRNYVNVAVGDNNFIIEDETVKVVTPPIELSFTCFLKGLMSIAEANIADYGS